LASNYVPFNYDDDVAEYFEPVEPKNDPAVDAKWALFATLKCMFKSLAKDCMRLN
jgi:hypothetical protein